MTPLIITIQRVTPASLFPTEIHLDMIKIKKKFQPTNTTITHLHHTTINLHTIITDTLHVLVNESNIYSRYSFKQCEVPYRPPSKPRPDRYRSRS